MSASKGERFNKFLERLSAAPPAASAEDALALVSKTLNEVEDEFTSIPYNPDLWMDDGRMYPPQTDSCREDPAAGVVRYRSRRHHTRIHVSGAIRIEEVNGLCLLQKPGRNGQSIPP
jgi:hypothetical protein